MLRDAGFDEVIAEDRTDLVCQSLWFTLFDIYISLFFWSSNKIITCVLQFMKTLQQELNALENKKQDFIDEFSEVG